MNARARIGGFECPWDDRSAGRPSCRYESRFKPDVTAGGGWSRGSTTVVRFRHAGDGGWCWFERR